MDNSLPELIGEEMVKFQTVLRTSLSLLLLLFICCGDSNRATQSELPTPVVQYTPGEIVSDLDGYIQYLFNRNLFGFTPSWEESVRLTLVFNDDLILGGYLSRFLPLLIGLIILSFKNDKLVISVSCILLILTDILVYVSGERTAMGLLLISTILIIFLFELKF